MTVTRGPLGISGKPNDLAITAPLNSTYEKSGSAGSVQETSACES